MKMIKYGILCLLLNLVVSDLPAQKDFSKIKSEDVGPGDFMQTAYAVDSSATAIFLGDFGSTNFTGNESGGFNYVFKRIARIKILNKNGYAAAVWKIMLYQGNGKSEVLSDVKGITYNLENGKIIKTLLDDKDVYETRLDKAYFEKKFTLPGIREGSVIEVSYTITSPFIFNLQPWFFQNTDYPRLWSEYQVAIPGLLNYFFIKHGVDSFFY